MDSYQVYRDIKARTNGEIYIGVVGPVRSGKSTFIKRFIELMVLPKLTDEGKLKQATDEIPQSSGGRTIMTTEPKFIPKEATELTIADGLTAKVRLIDCVGFMVEGASGHIENEEERMVKTPWFDYEIPFTQAAEIGTRKVITDHSTIGIVVTSDGSFGDLRKEAYEPAARQAIDQIKELGKPFVVILNTAKPYSEETKKLAEHMQEEYGVKVAPLNCEQLKEEDIVSVMELVLGEFPVTQISFFIPKWMEILSFGHTVKQQMLQYVKHMMISVQHMYDIEQHLSDGLPEFVRQVSIQQVDLADGSVSVLPVVDDSFYFQILSDYAGMEISDEYQLMKTVRSYASHKTEMEKQEDALRQARQRGYSVITPEKDDIVLETPEIIRHGNQYGVKMRAIAPSLNLIKADICTEIAPIVGSKEQAEDLVHYMKEQATGSENGVWDTNIFGKSIEQIVEDGIQAKITQMTDDCQQKLQDALQKIINDSNGGMICIII